MGRRRTPMPARPARVQRGLTLVELMVGIGLGMIIVAALLLVLANTSNGSQNLQRSALQLENGRYAAELLQDELQMAGFFGELAVSGAAYADPAPCSTTPGGYAAAPLTLPSPVRGIAPADAAACLSYRRSGTYALVVRRLSVDATAVASIAGNANWYLQSSSCASDPGSTPLVFDHEASAFTLRNRACNAANSVRASVNQIYFVAGCNRCGSGGDSVPTLKRMDLQGGQWVETSLVDGVEELRFEYGFDTDGDGSPDVFLTAPSLDAASPASKLSNVVALRVHYVTRSVDAVSGSPLGGSQTLQLGNTGTVDTASDGYVRRAYSTTVRLVNPSAAREAQ